MDLWQEIRRRNIVRWEELAELIALPFLKTPTFPLNIPRRLAEKIEKGNPGDPILRQFVPLVEEENVTAGFGCDPVGDSAAQKTPRLLHKYSGRVLLTTTSACAMHCRYCFRQHFPYEKKAPFAEEIAYIAGDPSIHEVILSGGDPLSLSNRALGALIGALEEIPHLQILRFHTRFPIGIPERLDSGFKALLRGRLQPIVVLHVNHPRELDEDVIRGVRGLGVPLLNQAVLLRGVNDTLEVQKALSLKLIQSGILPYYLHQLDRVQGAAHFELPEEEGLALIEALREVLPGYAVPRYVREVAGEVSKTPLPVIQREKGVGDENQQYTRARNADLRCDAGAEHGLECCQFGDETLSAHSRAK